MTAPSSPSSDNDRGGRPKCGFGMPVGKAAWAFCTLEEGHHPYGQHGHFDSSAPIDFGPDGWTWNPGMVG